jgi:DNA-directed RNA polymerase subunit RPC12/RpoP
VKEREKEKLLEKFVKNLPFKIYIRQQKINYNNEKTIFLDKDNFNKLSKQFKELFKLKSFKSSIEKTEIAKEYEIIVEFNQESNYINKDTFKLNNFEQHSLEYIIKKEEPKNEEEDNGKMTLSKCLKKFCKEEQLEEGDEWYCPKCKKHVLAKKKMELYY